jgi:hypothetical protein
VTGTIPPMPQRLPEIRRTSGRIDATCARVDRVPPRARTAQIFLTEMLAEGAYLDQVLIGRIRHDGEAEREGHYRSSHTASVNA